MEAKYHDDCTDCTQDEYCQRCWDDLPWVNGMKRDQRAVHHEERMVRLAKSLSNLAANLAAAGAMQVMFDAGQAWQRARVLQRENGAWQPNVKGRKL